MSSPADRLMVIYNAYQDAYRRRASDLKSAMSNAQADAILANVEKLEAQYLKAAKASLEANGPNVEAAFEAAKAARNQVEGAYRDAKALPEKIRLVTDLTNAVTKLVSTASKPR
jgi:hypothetical protein